ncbi:MAG TPA: M20/M25/M40 family metallo-hydrolase [Gemmatimonadales bacterium]|nr:M20/M25/M40 family metallo-hydrolase [Gemmatimonadales bacterium]
MSLATRSLPLAALPLLGALHLSLAAAQEPIDTAANRRIREEGLTRSQVLATAIGLSDLSPPRLAGSPGYLSAARWARDRLRQWNIPTARLEPWGRNSPSWVLDRYALEMVSPWYLNLTAFPRAWSPATPRPVTGPVTVVRIAADSDLVRYTGKLRGRIVLNGRLQPVSRDPAPLRRFTDAELDSLSRLTDPGAPANAREDIDPWLEQLAWRRRYAAFLKREGALALIEPSGVETSLRVDGWYDYPGTPWATVPAFVVTRDHFNRLLRLDAAGQPVRITATLRAHTVQPDSVGYDVIAEIPGTDLADQVVMLGGHLDSWIAGTGAADNAAGCAVGLEALRILVAQGLRPRRTIRLALWDGEEPSEVYAGSTGWVQRHLADWKTGVRRPGYDGFSAYLNVDNGSGRIRGVYLQGNSAARPLWEALLAPFADLGANHVTLAATGETDHISFVAVGLPGFQFIQDPLDYDSRVHHSHLDTADYLVEDDLKQAATVLASVAYHLAMRDSLVPRP